MMENNGVSLTKAQRKMCEQMVALAQQYGTDKLTHGYLPCYARHLPSKPKRILEIGCWKGDSMRMWRALFPEAELHTLDLFSEHQPPADIPGLICHKGSQSDPEVLRKIAELQYDVVIDDGSHNTIDQNVTLNFLFPNAQLYIVEDLHCCEEAFYRNGIPFEESILGRIKSGKFPHRHALYLDKIVFIYAA